jgi:peptide/nickel transport system ATP-binding protein
MTPPLLEIEALTLGTRDGAITAVREANLAIAPGEVVGIVGESGSGKTMLGRAVLGLCPQAIIRRGGEIRLRGEALTALAPDRMRRLRGGEIGMVFQEPMTSLNPTLTIGRQMEEGLELHGGGTRAERREKILAMLERVGMTDGAAALRAYPHQFSGGMRQRIMIASVMLLKPALLIADEPTTALDAVTQREVMDLLAALARENGTAVMLISHDLAMVARYCRRIVVMEKGDIVEEGATADLLAAPKHPYSRKLLASLPVRGPAREATSAEPVVSVRDLRVDFPVRTGIFARSGRKAAVKGVSLDVRPGEVLAVVGGSGSGSGKTTVARVIAGLNPAFSGTVLFNGRAPKADMAAFRRNCQMVFQDPFSSLDPRMKVGALIAEGLHSVPDVPRAQYDERLAEMLDQVSLDSAFADRFPHELSGGQRQRVAIARALIRRPSFIIADEAVSALDVTVRAQILDLLARLQSQLGFACLFITHDLAVVEQIADRVIVMEKGEIVEEGARDDVLDRPAHAYTRRLLGAIPVLDPTGTGGLRLRWRNETDATTAN